MSPTSGSGRDLNLSLGREEREGKDVRKLSVEVAGLPRQNEELRSHVS